MTTVLARLKAETRPQHDHLETNPFSVAIMNQTITRAQYRTMLARFYGFYAPLEPMLDHFDLSAVGIDFADRRKSHLLAADLRSLEMSLQGLMALPHCRELPQIGTLPRALGVLYVLEGATLGGQVISRQLKARHNLTPECGVAFFNSYGDQVGPRWKQFTGAVSAYSTAHPEHDDQLVAAAAQTFDCFANWLMPLPLHPASLV
ncbi:MAG: biliverdin-producing heme oxygenase [Chloroflexi bacterium]|nr:biliverdin-producing heme oxygenase [Chloroflexota bacterium]